MPTRTVQVSNLSTNAKEHNLRDFFSFSGEVEHVELQRDGDLSQVAYVTFKDVHALDTALLLSGATVVDRLVNITPVEEPEWTAGGTTTAWEQSSTGPESGDGENSAQDVMSSMLARGFVLGKDAMSLAKSFDEKHHLTANASATVSSFDKKTGISQKLSAGTSVVSEQLRAVDQKYQVSELTRSAFAVAEEKVNLAGTALLKNRYVSTGANWLTGAFTKVTKAAKDVNQRAKEKAALYESEEHRRGQGMGSVEQEYHSPFANSYGPPPPYPGERAAVSLSSAADSASVRYPNVSLGYDQYSPLQSSNEPSVKPPPAQGLIL